MGWKIDTRPGGSWWILLGWNLFIGIGAVAGSVVFWLDPSGRLMGMADHLVYFQPLPLSDLFFRDFTWPAVALFCVNGLPNLWAALLVVRKKAVAATWNLYLGCVLMGWVSLQFYLFPPNAISTLF
ncbi:MAG: hypothetical protein ACI30I_11200, partial [Parabacteroides sp.]